MNRAFLNLKRPSSCQARCPTFADRRLTHTVQAVDLSLQGPPGGRTHPDRGLSTLTPTESKLSDRARYISLPHQVPLSSLRDYVFPLEIIKTGSLVLCPVYLRLSYSARNSQLLPRVAALISPARWQPSSPFCCRLVNNISITSSTLNAPISL